MDQDSFDGLDFSAAMALCVRRAHSLGRSETRFLMRIGRPDRALSAEDKLRLAAIVHGLRQGDIVDLVYAAPRPERDPP